MREGEKKKERPGNKANAGKVTDRKRQVWTLSARMLWYKQQLPDPPSPNPPLSLPPWDMPTCLSNRLQPHISLLATNQPVCFLSLKENQKNRAFFVVVVCCKLYYCKCAESCWTLELATKKPELINYCGPFPFSLSYSVGKLPSRFTAMMLYPTAIPTFARPLLLVLSDSSFVTLQLNQAGSLPFFFFFFLSFF